MPDNYKIFLVTYVTILTTCLAEPPSRLNLYRFFMGFGPELNQEHKISFNPDAGLRYREQYEKKYGPRGALLIERFGKGLGPEDSDITDIEISETTNPINQDIESSKRQRKTINKKKDLKEKEKHVTRNSTLETANIVQIKNK